MDHGSVEQGGNENEKDKVYAVEDPYMNIDPYIRRAIERIEKKLDLLLKHNEIVVLLKDLEIAKGDSNA